MVFAALHDRRTAKATGVVHMTRALTIRDDTAFALVPVIRSAKAFPLLCLGGPLGYERVPVEEAGEGPIVVEHREESE